MFFFVGWPKVVPLKHSEVVDIQHNGAKIWTVILTKDRISVWTFALNQNILLGFMKRSDIDKYGENHFVLWSNDSRKIAVITTKLCVYLYNIEEINEFVITNTQSLITQHQNNQNNANSIHSNPTSLTPKVKKIRIIPYKLLHLMKLPPYSTITRACHLTNDTFVISTNYAQFIHIHWKGHVELTCQLNLKTKAPTNNSNNGNQANEEDNSPPVTPSTPNDNPNWGRPRALLPLVRNNKNDSIGIVDLAMSNKLGIMVVVFESGSCWIIPLQKLSKNVATHNLSVNQTTYVSEYENVTCCDICDRFHFLALGLSTGNVVIYNLNLETIQPSPPPQQNGSNLKTETKLQFRLELLVIFSAHQYNLIPQTFALDDVREVSWSDAGTSLAISWKKGVVVYSVRGIVVFSTLHHQIHGDNAEEDEDMSIYTNHNHKNENKKPKEEDPVTTFYPSCLKWLQKDSGFIMVTHKHQVTNDDFNHYLKQYQIEKKLKQKQNRHSNHQPQVDDANNNDDDEIDAGYICKHDAYLMQIKCLKHTLGNLSQSDVSKLALLGSNYISIWRPVHIIDDPESTDYWSRIEIDSHYLSRNWPIRELAVNLRSDCFAIAGSTGFALYYRKTARWRIVRSLDGENILFTCVMAWLSNDLIFIATFDPTFRPSQNSTKQSKWNLLCFDRWEIDRYFNATSGIPISSEFIPMMEYPLTNHPIGMEAVDTDKLLIYFVDGVIHIYDINIDHGGKSHSSSKLHANVGNNNTMDNHTLKTYPIISLKNYCVLAPFRTLSPHPVSLRIWNYGHNKSDKDTAENIIAQNANKDDAGFCILSLDASRSLYKINPVNNDRELITENVHDFYLMRETRDKNDKCYLWTYGLNSVKRWDVYYDKQDSYKLKLKSLFVSPVQPHMTCIGICNTLNVLVYGRRIIRRIQPLYTPRFAIHIDIRSYLHVTIKEKLNSIGLEPTFDFVLKAIAGGAWRCLNALENILRSSLQKRYKLQRKRKNESKNSKLNTTTSSDDQLTEANADGATLPFDQDALLLQQSLRSTYVFYPNDVEREFSRQNLRQNELQKEIDLKNQKQIKYIQSKTGDSPKHNKNSAKKLDFDHGVDEVSEANDSLNDEENVEDEDEDDDGGSINDTLMMMSNMSFDEIQNNNGDEEEEEEEKKLNNHELVEIEKEEKEIEIVIKFLRKFPDYPGIVVNVARKTEPSQWNDLFKLCGSPIMLVEKSISRNQLATASKYLYVFEKIYIEYAIHFATVLIELSIESGSDNLVLSLLRFSHKLKLMIKESHENNIEIPQLNVVI